MSLPSPDNDLLLSPNCLRLNYWVLSLCVQYHNHTVAVAMLLIPTQVHAQPPDVAKNHILTNFLTTDQQESASLWNSYEHVITEMVMNLVSWMKSPVVTVPDQGDHAVPPPPAQLPRVACHCDHLSLNCVRLHLEDVMITTGHCHGEVTSLTEWFVCYSLAGN